MGETLGEAYVHLDYHIGVHFKFRDNDVVACLKKGDKIVLEGRVDSNLGSLIDVKNCVLVDGGKRSVTACEVPIEQAQPVETPTAKPAEVQKNDGIPVISAEDLEQAFSENEVAAKKKYGGKIYKITGVIDSFSTDIWDESPIVRLKAGGLLHSCSCHFPASAKDQVSSLKKGAYVTIQGKIGDYLLGVQVKNCKLVK